MRKPSQEEVAATARARLEQLARELDRAGVTRLQDQDRPHQAAGDRRSEALDELPAPAVVPRAGRHAASAPARPRVRDRVAGLLPDTVRGRVTLDGGSLRVVALLVVVGVVLAGVTWSRSQQDSTPAPAAARTEPLTDVPTPAEGTAPPSAGGGGAAATPSAATSAGPVPGQGVVLIHVAGKVRDPGVVELPTGSRVIDALDRAGGPRRGVDLTGLNLARVLADGEQLLVGRDLATAPVAPPAAAGAGPGIGTGTLVSLNTADLDQLDTLPGVGPVTAQKILDWRAANGVFSAVEELLEIDGIGDKTLAEIAPHVTL